jgi:hypothetical protein
MRKILPILCLTLSLGLASAETTRKEETRVTTPAEDAKPNSDKVPDAYALDGQFDRIVVVRFKYHADLLSALEHVVKEQKIRNEKVLVVEAKHGAQPRLLTQKLDLNIPLLGESPAQALQPVRDHVAHIHIGNACFRDRQDPACDARPIAECE